MLDQQVLDQQITKKPTVGRLLELDSLRGIACICVMLFHYTAYYHHNWGHAQTPIILFEYGKYGVELFFLISGFVIFMSLKKKNIKDFLVLRFWRLFPTYWFAVVAIFVVSYFIPILPEVAVHGRITPLELLVNFTMIPTVFSLRYVDSSHWSLGFELLFYLYISAFFLLGKLREIRVVYVFLFLTSLSVFWHISIDRFFDIQAWMTVWWKEDMSHWQYVLSKVFILPYVHLFLMGISLYLIHQKRKIILSVFCIIFGIAADYFIWGWEHLIAVTIITLVFSTAISFKMPFLRNKFLLYLGAISYSLYLIHQNIGFRIIQIAERNGVNSNIAILAAILLVIFLAHPLHFWLEKPSYKFIKQRLSVSKKANNIAS